MAFFQNINKIISSQLLTRPNSFVLTSCYRPVFLQTDKFQKIEHVHSVKALVKTIQELERLRTHQDWAETINKQLGYYEDNLADYSYLIKAFVKNGGSLTGEGIGNLYFSAEKLYLTPDWLEQNVHHEVILKHKYMTRQNLIDTIEGVKKFHQDSPYLKQLEQQLSSRPDTKVQYASRLPNQTASFESAENSKSNNTLINSILNGKSRLLYPVESIVSSVLWGFREALHSE